MRTWLPELRAVPVPQLYAPFIMNEEEQAACGVKIGEDYPAPAPLSGKLQWAVKRL